MSTILSRAFVVAALSLAANPAFAQANTQFPARVCDVTQYGAQGSKLWLDTVPFQKAIDDCAAQGGGTVRVPRGFYLTGPLFLKSNIRLQIDQYAELLAASDPALYGTTDHPMTPEGISAQYAFINISNAENVAITGAGLIDGQGAVWWERMRAFWRDDAKYASNGAARQNQKDSRPRLVMVRDSKNIQFQGVHFVNSPSFHIVLRNTENVTIDHIAILAPAHAPNTDAIDPINSRNVLISNNLISCGDDVVAIKAENPDPKHPDAATANIIVRNNKILQGRGISIGSGTRGGVKHVLIENNTFDGSMYGFRIKTRRGHGGEVSDIVFRNATMTNVQTPFVLSGYYEYKPLDAKEAAAQVQSGGFILGNQMWPGEKDPAQPFVQDKTPDIHDVTIENVVATGAERIGVITGLPERAIKAVTLSHVRVDADSGLLLRHASVTSEATSFTVKNGKAVTQQQKASFSSGK